MRQRLFKGSIFYHEGIVDICFGVMLRLSFSTILFIEDSWVGIGIIEMVWIGFLLRLYSLALEKIKMNQN